MPMSYSVYFIAFTKIILSLAAPIVGGIFIDKTFLQSTAYFGFGFVLGIIMAAVVFRIGMDWASTGIKRYLESKSPA